MNLNNPRVNHHPTAHLQREPTFDATASNVTFDSAEYELLWPRDLFVRELTAVHTTGWAGDGRVARLLEEAFLTDAPVLDYKRFDADSRPPDRHRYVAELLLHAPRLREHGVLRPLLVGPAWRRAP